MSHLPISRHKSSVTALQCTEIERPVANAPDQATPHSSDVLTREDLLRARDQMLENRPYEAHVHVVHPRHTGRRVALSIEEADVKTVCAFCFQTIWLTKVID